jgi:hypothetical protein
MVCSCGKGKGADSGGASAIMLSHVGLIVNICWCWRHSFGLEVLVLSLALISSLQYHYVKDVKGEIGKSTQSTQYLFKKDHACALNVMSLMWIYMADSSFSLRLTYVALTMATNGIVASRSDNMALNMAFACALSFALNFTSLLQLWSAGGYDETLFIASCIVSFASASCLVFWQNLLPKWSYWVFHSCWHLLGSVGIQLLLLSKPLAPLQETFYS